MPSIFDNKIWNDEVFQKYIDSLDNIRRNELIRSRAIRPRPDLKAAMSDNVAGNYITTPLAGNISGTAPQNYDGATNFSPNSLPTFQHSRVVVGRMAAWTERDFTYDITGGQDFLAIVGQQISDYWQDIDQETIISILTGVFKMSDDAGAAFVAKHTYDVTAIGTGTMDATTLNTGMQKALGDNKSKFALAIMHSAVATGLENLNLLAYLKYTDSNGIERELGLGTLNGRLVLVDDHMPAIPTEVTAGVYEVALGGTYTATDKITIAGTEVTTGSTSKSTIASTVATAMASNATYTVTAESDKIILTEKTGKYGTGAPTATTDSSAGTLTVTTKTAADKPIFYTTYVLGDGAIEYTDCGAKVPSEVDRDPKTNGGQDTLYTRQRKCFAPYGISFTKASMSSLSPSAADLETGANWELVNNGALSKTYIEDKRIPIARILSRA